MMQQIAPFFLSRSRARAQVPVQERSSVLQEVLPFVWDMESWAPQEITGVLRCLPGVSCTRSTSVPLAGPHSSASGQITVSLPSMACLCHLQRSLCLTSERAPFWWEAERCHVLPGVPGCTVLGEPREGTEYVAVAWSLSLPLLKQHRIKPRQADLFLLEQNSHTNRDLLARQALIGCNKCQCPSQEWFEVFSLRFLAFQQTRGTAPL